MRKNVVFYVTRQYMKQNKGRTFVTFIGIVFMVILMTGVFIGKDTGIGYLEEIASLKDGKWHVSIYGVTEEMCGEVQSLPYVRETARSKGYGATEFEQSANDERPYLNVKAYEPACFDWMNIHLTEGRLPENEQEIVISRSAIDDGAKIQTGDWIDARFFQRSITGINAEAGGTIFPFFGIELEYGETKAVPESFPYYGENESFRENVEYTGKTGRYQVVGIIEAPSYEDSGAAGYTAVTGLGDDGLQITASSDNSGTKDTCNLTMLLDLEVLPLDYAMELRNIAYGCEMDFNDYVLAFSANASESTLNMVIRYMTVVFVVLIMGASVLLIYNVFNMSFQERSRYLGMLCSVGATGRQKRSSIYYESFCLLIFALPTGILGGMGIIRLAMLVFRPLLGMMVGIQEVDRLSPVSVRISWENIAAVILVSVLTVLISAWLPARKIGKIGPIECIRGNVEKKSRQYAMRPSVIRRFGAEGMLAGNMLTRQKRRPRSVAVSAAVFMIILIVTVYGTRTVHEIIDVKIDRASLDIRSEDYDYLLGSYGYSAEYDALKEEILNDPGVEKVSEWGEGMFTGQVPASVYGREYWEAVREIFSLYYHRDVSEEEVRQEDMQYKQVVNILAVPDEYLRKIGERAGADVGRLMDTEHPAALVVKEGVISTDTYRISETEPEHYRIFRIENMSDLGPGDEIPLELYDPDQEKNVNMPVEVAGNVSEELLSDYVTFGNDNQYVWLLVNADVSRKIARIAGGREGTAGLSPMLFIKQNEEPTDLIGRLEKLNDREDSYFAFARPGYQKDLIGSLAEIADILLGCFVVLTSVICLLNLFNSIRGWRDESRQDIAVLYSVGMTKEQMNRLLLYECLGIFLRAVLLAGVCAGFLYLMIQAGVKTIFGNLRIPFPAAGAALSAALAGVVLVLITILVHRKISF